MVEVLEHPSLSNDIANALRPYDCDTASATFSEALVGVRRCRQTLIFSYILERKCEAGVLALDDAHFAKGSFADYSQQPEVVEVHCLVWSDSFTAGVAGADGVQQGP